MWFLLEGRSLLCVIFKGQSIGSPSGPWAGPQFCFVTEVVAASAYCVQCPLSRVRLVPLSVVLTFTQGAALKLEYGEV